MTAGFWISAAGGGRRATYMRFLPAGCDLSSVNIDAEFEPTHRIEPGDPLPFEDETFDTVITFNTLEHIQDDAGAVRELHRVMKPGARLHIVVPFLYRVHGHPDDYNRHTPSWWRATLEDIGFSAAELTPLIFGRTTAARLISGRGNKLVRPLNDFLGAARDIVTARVLFPGQDRYTGSRGERVWGFSPGWYICATR